MRTTMFAFNNLSHRATWAVLVNRLPLTLPITSQPACCLEATHGFLLALLRLTTGKCKSIGILPQAPLTSTSSWFWPTWTTTIKFMPWTTCLWSKVAPIWRQSVIQLTEKPMDVAQHLNCKNYSSVTRWWLPQPLTGHKTQKISSFLEAIVLKRIL